MPKVIEGKIDAKGLKVAIVCSRFNEFVSKRLLEGAVDALVRHGAKDGDIDVFLAPGSFEIPAVTKRVIQSKSYNGVICIGTLIRGGTPHFDYLSAEVTKGIALLSLESDVPIVYGVITTDTIEQAIERAGTKMGNKGWDAAMALIEMCSLYKQT